MNIAWKIWSVLSPAQKRAGVGLLGWMLISMLFEMLGIGLMLPALTAMSGSASAMSSPRFQRLLDALGNPSQVQLVIGGILALLVIYFLKAFFVLISAWRQTTFVRNLERTISERLFATYMTQPWEFHLQRNSAELIRNMTNVGHCADAIALVVAVAAEMLILGGIAVVLLFIDPLASIVVGCLAVGSTWLLDRLTKQRSIRWGGIKHTHQALLTRAIHQGLGGVKDAKVLGCESEFVAEYSSHAGVLAAMAERNSIISVVPRLWNEMLGVSALCLLTLIMLWQGVPVEALVPTLGVFAAAAFRMLPSVNRVSMALQSLRYASELTNAVVGELGLSVPDELPTTVIPMPFRNAIALNEVCYRYLGAASNALDSVDIRIPFGSSVGIIGSSGAGKSTLVDIILGLLSPTSGQVRVDGADIAGNRRGWQKNIGYVSQSIYLCDDTIRANVAFGVPPDKVDCKALKRALQVAQLDDFVAGLPDGMNTCVGERGVRLSGGQRQRIGIARALYHDPPVLVLDEATSALDGDTERGVMESVNALHGAKTLIIIAHRLSTVANCDLLYRLERGRVERSGTFGEVVSK